MSSDKDKKEEALTAAKPQEKPAEAKSKEVPKELPKEAPVAAAKPSEAPAAETKPKEETPKAPPVVAEVKPSEPAKETQAAEAKPKEEAPKAPLAKIAVIIDDEPANRDFLERLIQQAKFETKGAATGAEAQKLMNELPVAPMVVVIDSELPDMKGLELLKIFRPKYPDSRIIMATMLDDRALIDQVFENGGDAFLVKPHGFMELFKRLMSLEQNPTALNNLVFDMHGVRPRRK